MGNASNFQFLQDNNIHLDRDKVYTILEGRSIPQDNQYIKKQRLDYPHLTKYHLDTDNVYHALYRLDNNDRLRIWLS